LAEVGYSEAARVDTDNGVLVAAMGPIERDGATDPFAQMRSYRFTNLGDVWVDEYSGGWDSCIHLGGFERDGELYEFLVGFEPGWIFTVSHSGLTVDVPMVDGVATITPEVYSPFRDAGMPADAHLTVRAYDENGEWVDCAEYFPPYVEENTDTTHVVGQDEGTTDLTVP
jgi:hypothetical protein